MNGSAKIQSRHLQRQAVVYLRQSSPNQVRHNKESAVNQRALRERLLELGWKKEQIVIIEDDQGTSAKQVDGRDAFQKLTADIRVSRIGIIMGYEVSRLSRDGADWQQLLKACAVYDTLVGDSDGIYHPREFNDKLLLDLKGTMSEAELHSLRLRLDAGRLSKAKRGELAQQLPTGLVRTPAGVTFDPDRSVQDRIRLVFRKFLELGSRRKVLRYFVQHDFKLPRRQVSGPYAGTVLWKDASEHALELLLTNPAYAGAFAYGRKITDVTRQVPGRKGTGRIRQPSSQWQVLVRDKYPAYITWEEYEQIQAKIKENQHKMHEPGKGKNTVRSGGALLTSLVCCSMCGHHMRVRYEPGRWRYICDVAQLHYGKAPCQSVSGLPVDEAVVAEFFKALSLAQIDALEQVSRRQADHQQELLQHLKQEVTRLDYAAKRAQRQYNCVDPENRLIAATLEKSWEEALRELEQAKACLSAAEEAPSRPLKIARELREAFADAGRRLPELWPRLGNEAKKSLLRTLVSGVNVLRHDDGMVQLRIAWRGGLVTETSLRVPVRSLQQTGLEKEFVARIQQLAEEGLGNDAIATRLNAEEFRPCRGQAFTEQIVAKLKARFGIEHKLAKVRRGNLPTGYTVREMARLIKVDPSWIYRAISVGKIEVSRDPEYACYLFPRQDGAVDAMREL
jgi:DNA invertase Pin-like site-specific DNA recombinase